VKKRTRFNYTDLFTRKLIITIPRLGAVAIALSLVITTTILVVSCWKIQEFGFSMGLTGMIFTLVAWATIIETRYQLRRFRYEIQERLTAALDNLALDDAREEIKDNAETDFIRLPK
jgi:membrane protein YdbS with pleckstrin-like domain